MRPRRTAVAVGVGILCAGGVVGTRPAWWPSLPELAGDVASATGCLPGRPFDVTLAGSGVTDGRGLLCRKGASAYFVAVFDSQRDRDRVAADHAAAYPMCQLLRDATPLPGHHWIVGADCAESTGMAAVRRAVGGDPARPAG